MPEHLDALASQTTSLLYQLADAAAAVQDTTQAAGDAAKNNSGGFFGPLASLFETILKVSLLQTKYASSCIRALIL